MVNKQLLEDIYNCKENNKIMFFKNTFIIQDNLQGIIELIRYDNKRIPLSIKEEYIDFNKYTYTEIVIQLKDYTFKNNFIDNNELDEIIAYCRHYSNPIEYRRSKKIN